MVSLLTQTKGRIPWLAAIGSLCLIWLLWSLGIGMNPVPAHLLNKTPLQHPTPLKHSTPSQHPSNHLNSAPAEVAGPIPIAKPSVPKFDPFDTFLDHLDDRDFVSDRPLILYAFFETELARINLEFFLHHAIHNEADFLFILNGETDADLLLPVAGNVRFLRRANDCFDLGAFAEVFVTNDLYKKYNKYIMMNSSIRGPFFPYWAMDCWSERYLSKITSETKLVGMTMNCAPRIHVQSMIWATDRVGLEVLLFPSEALKAKYLEVLGDRDHKPVPKMKVPGINSCPHEYWDAVAIEVYATGLLQTAGYKVDPIMMAYHSSKHYEQECVTTHDLQGHGRYYGMDIHPYDTIFVKTNRGNDPHVLKMLTEWTDQWGYTSFDACKKAYAGGATVKTRG
ncbi:hypothetical protein LZ554_001151 [Drepanopeziza brunnea f. sp. 'monogermtubi']|nr:hypothetical protein LZ554_001151 [Drepanopeziza brunnea f. sp. 'monogermtubi']